MILRSLVEADAWLRGLINVERRPDWPYSRLGLDPIQRLLARLGDPQRSLGVVHVAGSKGKGSTVLLAEAVLVAAGEPVGSYVSPHLERWTERIRLGGREVGEDRLVSALERVRPHLDALRAESPDDAPSFFDALTAAAFVCFRDAGIERALIEVGLGGRLDSTNVVAPRVGCITSIELEHTDRLGSTLAEIAREKAGIVKPAVPLVAGELPAEARRVVAARARETGSPVAWLGRDFRARVLAEGPEGLCLQLEDGPLQVDVRLPLLGRHQAANAALALACLRRAGGLATGALRRAAERGLAGARLPGRVELLRTEPAVLVDSAHTAASARALAAALRVISRRRTRLVLSVSAGKDTAAILEALLPLADDVTVTRAEPSRSLAAPEVAAAVRACAPRVPLRVVPNPHLALRAAAEGLASSDCLCATGSVYLAGIARRILSEPRAAAPPHEVSRSPVVDG